MGEMGCEYWKTIDREWFDDLIRQYIITQLGCMEEIKSNNLTQTDRDKIFNYMRKMIIRKHQPKELEIALLGNRCRAMCAEWLNS